MTTAKYLAKTNKKWTGPTYTKTRRGKRIECCDVFDEDSSSEWEIEKRTGSKTTQKKIVDSGLVIHSDDQLSTAFNEAAQALQNYEEPAKEKRMSLSQFNKDVSATRYYSGIGWDLHICRPFRGGSSRFSSI